MAAIRVPVGDDMAVPVGDDMAPGDPDMAPPPPPEASFGWLDVGILAALVFGLVFNALPFPWCWPLSLLAAAAIGAIGWASLSGALAALSQGSSTFTTTSNPPAGNAGKRS